MKINAGIITFIFLSLLILNVAIANRENYFKSYEFIRSDLINRSDLKKSYNYHHKLPLDVFSEVELDGTKITMFKDVLDVFHAFRYNRVPNPVEDKFEDLCEISISEALPDEALKIFQKACSKISRPELNYDYTIQNPYQNKYFKDVDGLIQVFLPPLALIDLPESVLTTDFKNKGRTALLRVQYERLIDPLIMSIEELEDMNEIKLAQELKRVQSFLDNIFSSGLSRASLQQVENTAYERCRESLSYPALTDEDREFLSMYLGMLAWRVRGEALWKKRGTQELRKFFAEKAFSVLINLNSGSWGLGDDVGEVLRRKLQIKGWSEWMDMGKHDGDKWIDLIGMTRRGMFQVGEGRYYPIGLGGDARKEFRKRGFDDTGLKVGAAQMGSCYYLSHEIFEYRTEEEIRNRVGRLEDDPYALGEDLRGKDPYTHFLHGGIRSSSYGELCFGGTLGLGMAKSLLLGKTKNCH